MTKRYVTILMLVLTLSSSLLGSIKMSDLIEANYQYNEQGNIIAYNSQTRECYISFSSADSSLALDAEIGKFLERAKEKIPTFELQSVETIFINSRKLERFPGSIYDFHQLKNLDISRTAIDLTKPGNPLLKNLIRENVWAVALPENASISTGQLKELSPGHLEFEGLAAEFYAFLARPDQDELLVRTKNFIVKSPDLESLSLLFILKDDRSRLEVLDLRGTGITRGDRVINLLTQSNNTLEVLYAQP
jgi:hypothetical protein